MFQDAPALLNSAVTSPVTLGVPLGVVSRCLFTVAGAVPMRLGATSFAQLPLSRALVVQNYIKHSLKDALSKFPATLAAGFCNLGQVVVGCLAKP